MPDDLQSDRILTERARQGDAGAWQSIYEQTCAGLFAFLCYQIGDRDEARDLLQETYLQAFRRLDTYRGEAPLAVWLRTIAFGRSIDWKRVVLRRLKRSTTLDEAALAAQSDGMAIHFDSERSVLRRALAILSPRQRAALLLREWEERTFAEIAHLLGCAESTARVHHTRARERMREAMNHDAPSREEREWKGQES